MGITELEIRNLFKEYGYATNTHIFSNVKNLISQNAIYRFTDGDFIGINEIQKAFENTWNSIKNESYSLSNLLIIKTDNDSASVTYNFQWSGVVDGKQKSGEGRGTNVIVRNGKQLQFIYEHLSK